MPTTITMSGPGTATLVDDAAAAIKLQTVQQKADNERIIKLMALQVQSLNRLADSQEKIAKSIADLNIAIGTITSAASSSNALNSLNIVSQIQANNFQLQTTKEALIRADLPLPTLPTLEEQIKTLTKEAAEFNSVARLNGTMTDSLQSIIQDTGQWVSGTETYQTVSNWIKKAKDTLLSPFIPSKATVQQNKEAETIGGVPPIIV